MSTASDLLAKYLAAEAAILGGQSVRHESGRTLTMADLAEVRAERKALERRVADEARASAGDTGARHMLADFS